MYKSNLSCGLPFSPFAGVREQKEKGKRKQKFNDEVPIITFSIQRLKRAHTHTQTHCRVKQRGVAIVQGHRGGTFISVLSNTVAR